MKLWTMLVEKFVKKPSTITCPFCHDKVQGRKWVCPKCQAAYHLDCLGSSGKCVNVGCTGRISPISYGVKPEIKDEIKKMLHDGASPDFLIQQYGEAAYLDASRELN